MERVTRAEYEAACAEHGFKVKEDEDLEWLAERYDYGAAGSAYTSLSDLQKAELGLKIQRGLTAARERAEQAERKVAKILVVVTEPGVGTRHVPAMCGQLWEECERCGREPVYQPLFLCEGCWPKG